MSLQQFFLILRSRFKVAMVVLLATMTLTLLVSLLLPNRYTSSTSVVVDVRTPDPIGGLVLPTTMMASYMPTQVDIVNSERVARKVVSLLKLDQSPAIKEQWLEATDGKGRLDVWLGELLQKKLTVKPSRESDVINISFVSSDPAFSAAVANAFAQAYIDTNVELKVEPARQYSKWFQVQTGVLRENLERAQARLSDYQQKEGIVVTDERLDSENAKLNELSTQLTIVQGQTTDTLSKQHSGGRAANLPEFMQNPVIQNLRIDIARLEAKAKEASGNLGVNHPQYQRMHAELDTLRQKLDAEGQHVAGGFATASNVGKEKETVLKRLIAGQKEKLLELKHQRDQAAVLLGDVAAAQKAFDAVAQRFTQTSLESQTTQTNISVLTPAIVPIEPSSPLPLFYTLIAGLVGLVLGVAAAFGMEMSDRRVRTADDLEYGLGFALPVLIELDRQGGLASRSWLRLGRLAAPPRLPEFVS